MQEQDAKILAMLKKVNELAKNGVDGERETAQQKLEYLMKKYGVSISQLEQDAVTERVFKIKQEQKNFFIQVVFNVCGRVDVFYAKKDKHNKYIRQFVNVTELQYIEIMEKFEFYWAKYEADLVIFYKAFIHKNKLFTRTTEDSDDKELTQEQIEEYGRVRKMMSGMSQYEMQKLLESAK